MIVKENDYIWFQQVLIDWCFFPMPCGKGRGFFIKLVASDMHHSVFFLNKQSFLSWGHAPVRQENNITLRNMERQTLPFIKPQLYGLQKKKKDATQKTVVCGGFGWIITVSMGAWVLCGIQELHGWQRPHSWFTEPHAPIVSVIIQFSHSKSDRS